MRIFISPTPTPPALAGTLPKSASDSLDMPIYCFGFGEGRGGDATFLSVLRIESTRSASER